MPPKTSAKAAVKSGKATKTVAKGDKKKRKGKRKESYAIYIYKVNRCLIVCLFIISRPGAEAGAPRHRRLLQGHVHHELVRERPLREDRRRGQQARPLQQEVDYCLFSLVF